MTTLAAGIPSTGRSTGCKPSKADCDILHSTSLGMVTRGGSVTVVAGLAPKVKDSETLAVPGITPTPNVTVPPAPLTTGYVPNTS